MKLRRPKTLEVLGESRAARWRDAAIQAYNQIIVSERAEPRLHIRVVREVSPKRRIVQFGYRSARTHVIELDPEIVVDVEGIAEQTP